MEKKHVLDAHMPYGDKKKELTGNAVVSERRTVASLSRSRLFPDNLTEGGREGGRETGEGSRVPEVQCILGNAVRKASGDLARCMDDTPTDEDCFGTSNTFHTHTHTDEMQGPQSL